MRQKTSKFIIVKNISIQKKSVQVFGFSLPYNSSVNVLSLSYVNENIVKKSIANGELANKIKNKDIVIVNSNIDKLPSFNQPVISPPPTIEDEYIKKINDELNNIFTFEDVSLEVPAVEIPLKEEIDLIPVGLEIAIPTELEIPIEVEVELPTEEELSVEVEEIEILEVVLAKPKSKAGRPKSNKPKPVAKKKK